MATKKIRMRPEGDNDYGDVLHPETSADMIVETAGEKVMTAAERTKLEGIEAGAEVNTVNTVAGKTGAVVVTKSDVGLGSVENYSIATQAEAAAGTSDNKYMTPAKVVDTVKSLPIMRFKAKLFDTTGIPTTSFFDEWICTHAGHRYLITLNSVITPTQISVIRLSGDEPVLEQSVSIPNPWETTSRTAKIFAHEGYIYLIYVQHVSATTGVEIRIYRKTFAGTSWELRKSVTYATTHDHDDYAKPDIEIAFDGTNNVVINTDNRMINDYYAMGVARYVISTNSLTILDTDSSEASGSANTCVYNPVDGSFNYVYKGLERNYPIGGAPVTGYVLSYGSTGIPNPIVAYPRIIGTGVRSLFTLEAAMPYLTSFEGTSYVVPESNRVVYVVDDLAQPIVYVDYSF